MDKEKIKAVFKKPFFYKALIFVLAAAGVSVNPDIANAVIGVGTAIANSI